MEISEAQDLVNQAKVWINPEVPFERSHKPRTLVWLVFLLLSFRMIFHTYQNAVNVLIWDQWDYYEGLFFGRGWWDLFLWQHGPHRQGLGFWLTKVIAELSDWDGRVEAISISLLFVAASATALLVKHRLFKGWMKWDIVIPLIFLKLSTWEALYGKPNISHAALPIFLVLIFCLTMTIRGPYLKGIFLPILSTLTLYTGFGLMLGLIAPFYFSLEAWKQRKYRAGIMNGVACVFSLFALASFFVDYKNQPAVSCFRFPDPNPLNYITFLSAEFAMIPGFYGLFVVAFLPGLCTLALFCWVFWKVTLNYWNSEGDKNTGQAIVWVLFSFTMLFAVSSSVGRACLGPAAGFGSRYVPYLMPALFALYLFLLEQEKPWMRGALAFLLLTLVTNDFVTRPIFFRKVAGEMRARNEWSECYKKRENIEECNTLAHATVYPDPKATQLKWKLDYLKAKRLNLYE